MIRLPARTAVAICLLSTVAAGHAEVTLTRGTNFSIDVAADGRIVFDLLGTIRTVPAGGGVADEIPGGPGEARNPRWSPDGAAIVFQARDGGQEQLWTWRDGDPAARRLSSGGYFDHQPDWHPDGERVVFSSDRDEDGFDIWELDVPTGLAWRLTSLPGDETQPAWSADGENLVFIRQHDDEWSLVLRRRGGVEQVLLSSSVRISSPSWRPDGSLITFLRHEPGAISTDMVILSDPLIIRPLIEKEDFFVAPVAWRNRQSMFYTANGQIRQRNFNSWTSRNIPFRATYLPPSAKRPTAVEARELPVLNSPDRRWVLRAARLFDGVGGGYRNGLDIVIEGSRIAAVEERRDRTGTIVVDMGDLAVLPGFIDAWATLPANPEPSLGPLLLSFGLTTIVADTDDAERLNETWSGEATPGPLVLGSDWRPELEAISAMNLGIDALPTSPLGIRYEDATLSASAGPATVFSGLADSHTPGLMQLLDSRQARLLGPGQPSVRRFSEAPQLASQASSIVLGSEPNGLGPGVGLHAEFRALSGAGLDGEHVLRTAGVNAAAALGLALQAGRIAPGSVADLVIVDGDPLAAVADALKVVGVVRNGRFFSAIGLIERRQAGESVE